MASTFSLVDDGTMDTVVRCILCDVELRYNVEVEDDDPTWRPLTGIRIERDDADSDRRIEAALEMAADDHVCGDGGGQS